MEQLEQLVALPRRSTEIGPQRRPHGQREDNSATIFYCKGCLTCQKSTQSRTKRAPLIHYSGAMDIVGPRKRYILDYATRYPEEILTDQGSNFTSTLLTEIYRMLHVHPFVPHHTIPKLEVGYVVNLLQFPARCN